MADTYTLHKDLADQANLHITKFHADTHYLGGTDELDWEQIANLKTYIDSQISGENHWDLETGDVLVPYIANSSINLGSGDFTTTGAIAGSNLSGSNTGDQTSETVSFTESGWTAITVHAALLELEASIESEDFWDRQSGTTLVPHNSNDNIDLGSGDFTTTGIITGVTLTDGTFSVTAGVMTGVTNTNWDDAYSKRVDSWGNGLSFSANKTAVDYNNTNLKITASQINTIQNIATSSSPTFAGLTVVNAITEFSTDGTLGDDSDSAIPTEKAVKTYVDTQITSEDFLDGTITRVAGLVTQVTKGNRTLVITRDVDDNIESYTDGTHTWTYTRDVDGNITGWVVT